MRAVALSNESIQAKVSESFIPLKVEIPYGTPSFPLDWPALKIWQDTYVRMGGPKTTGITACTVVGPELDVEYGSTGSAFVWEMFDSIAYDVDKFSGMLDASLKHFKGAEKIRNDSSLNNEEKKLALRKYHRRVRRAVNKAGRFKLPPKGFKIEGAKELFRMTGDLTDQPPKTEKSSKKDGK